MDNWIKRVLLETRIGDWILALFEKVTGLAVVDLRVLENETIKEVGREQAIGI